MSDAASSVDAQYSSALAHHHAGRLAEAEQLYRLILAVRPRQHEVLHLLGAVCAQTERLDEAIGLMEAANQVNPTVALYYSNFGRVLSDAGRLDDAKASLARALTLDPNFAPALVHLGSIHVKLDQPAEAMDCFRKALALQPNNLDALSILGMMLYKAGRLVEAEQAYNALIGYAPDGAGGYQGLANIRHAQGRFDEAEIWYRRAVELAPGLVEAWCNLAGSLMELEQFAEAETACRTALAANPDYAPALSNLGLILLQRDAYGEAEALLRRAVAIAPDLELSYGNLAIALQGAGRYDEAERILRDLLLRFPDSLSARINLALSLLGSGQFAEAWPFFEARRFEPKLAAAYRRPEGMTRWSGEAAPGRIVRIQAEQGFGDMIQFCRYAPMVAARARVLMEAPTPLLRLFRTLAGVERVIGPGEATSSDLFCPIMSLPGVFGTLPDTIPAGVPYLSADPGQIGQWLSRTAPLGGLKIGIAWSGSPSMRFDRHRSIDPTELAPLLSTHNVSFVSLQKGGARYSHPNLADWTEALDDFADTAALIEALDLVISVDTAVLHLAGALGKPVWLLNRYVPDWRWGLEREDSAWYPTLRQFRQPSPGDWPSVLEQVARQLARLVALG